MPTPQEEIARNAAESTTALNPLMGGINRQELLGAVAMMLRSTMTNPVTTAKTAGKITAENDSRTRPGNTTPSTSAACRPISQRRNTSMNGLATSR